MAVVYIHKRKDTGDVFYVGIGRSERRAYVIQHRSEWWKRIVKKYGYIVEILLSDISWDEACVKEKELINFHGRANLGNGTLCNLTDGGEGTINVIVSDKTRQKMSISQIGKHRSTKGTHRSERIINKIHDRNAIEALKNNGNFISKYYKKLFFSDGTPYPEECYS
jgi:hypothetical protein